ncbi:hypothetical protein FRC0088_00135 [Corynebacterium diphtheriae]|nr:hypothetical protein FRC0088_00135 [Corynebacterium diphtheriae]
MRKKLRRLSTTHWCPAAGDFLDATVRFLQQGPRALIPQHVLRDERACVHYLAVYHETPSFGCHDLAGCLHGHVLRQDAVSHEADHAIFGILAKFSLACSKIFPSAQTEQNLGHFTLDVRGVKSNNNSGILIRIPWCVPDFAIFPDGPKPRTLQAARNIWS